MDEMKWRIRGRVGERKKNKKRIENREGMGVEKKRKRRGGERKGKERKGKRKGMIREWKGKVNEE